MDNENFWGKWGNSQKAVIRFRQNYLYSGGPLLKVPESTVETTDSVGAANKGRCLHWLDSEQKLIIRESEPGIIVCFYDPGRSIVE